ncbi:MAG TPA: SpoIVB peptidase S55 domain-containing protein [Spirochaetota bacterium]|nr:SpoIVB peptidase S55 domain-containing protein [Spirochaetota bacterium]HOM38252.1 SpoIVB peptidase S55 domain-containing protein [Spirochaetota bacterium]HPQ48530.1 SpoIVB peptidase S55 domain-containing protein [Spirochaetota bacterium]
MQRYIFPIFIIIFSITIRANILKIEQIKPGMKGYIVTADKDNKIEKFDFEVIDVIKKASVKRDIVLVKFYGDYIEKKGIAQGMSGSPAYIEGALIGALAYTWGYLKEPIGGIQPIEQMIPVMKNIAYTQKTKQKFISLDKELAEKIDIEYIENIKPEKTDLIPISTPLVISGFAPEVINLLKSKLDQNYFSIIDGGSSEKKSDNKTLNPGDAVAIPLVTGDANVAAIGTVTYKEGNKVLIFGHPFLGRGSIKLPMAKAFVHYIMPTLNVSWKFASASEIIGSVYNDQETAVAGIIGEKPEMIPLTLNIEKDGENFNYNYNLAKDPLFFPNLLSGIIMSSFFNIDPQKSEGSVTLEISVNIKNINTNEKKSFKINDFFVGFNSDTLYQSTMRLIFPLQYIVYNWFDDWDIEKIDIKMKKFPKYQVGFIEKATLLDKFEFYPGEIVKIKLYIRMYKDKYTEKIVNIKIPSNITTPSILEINISSSKIENATYMYQYRPVFIPTNIDQLLSIFQMESSFSDIAVWIDIPATSLIVDGNFMPNLPLSKIYYYGYRQAGNYYSLTKREKTLVNTNYFVTGYIKLPIKIVPR